MTTEIQKEPSAPVGTGDLLGRCALEVEFALREAATADHSSSLTILRDELKRMTAERDEWRKKHWNAHHHAHEMFLETLRLGRELDRPNT